MPGTSIINVENQGLSEPAKALVDRTYQVLTGLATPAVGFFRPIQTRRMAKAEADSLIVQAEAEAAANRILSAAEAERAELEARTARRILAEEVQFQESMEDVLSRAIPLLAADANPERIESGWLLNFLGKSRAYTDDEMRNVWARILAGQANNPGSFSRKTVNVLADMDKGDAERFGTLCRFVWEFPEDTEPVIYHRDELWERHGLTYTSLTDLESLGLIRTDLSMLTQIGTEPLPERFTASYAGRHVNIEFMDRSGGSLPIGHVSFTSAGRQINSIIALDPVEGLFELMCERWTDLENVASVEPTS